jgi:hypothetical protein
LGVPSIKKEESKNRGKQYVAWKEGGKKREKLFAAIVRVLYLKEEGA